MNINAGTTWLQAVTSRETRTRLAHPPWPCMIDVSRWSLRAASQPVPSSEPPWPWWRVSQRRPPRDPACRAAEREMVRPTYTSFDVRPSRGINETSTRLFRSQRLRRPTSSRRHPRSVLGKFMPGHRLCSKMHLMAASNEMGVQIRCKEKHNMAGHTSSSSSLYLFHSHNAVK